MRRLHRPPVQLPTLTTGPGATQREKDRQKRSQDPKAQLSFPDHWNRSDVRGALLAMQGWVCAFCERKLGEDRRGDVEHFRPKSATAEATHHGYWWLAYEFENYLLSCTTCNSTYKRTRFPIKPGASHVEYGTRAQLPQEARLLVDPAVDPIESWLRIDVMDDTCPVTVTTTDADAHLKAETTIGFFELNADRKLVQQRIRAREKATKNLEKGDIEELRMRASYFRPHGSTIRAFMGLFTTNEEVPAISRDDELLWLLEYVDEQLRLDAKLRRQGLPPPSERPIEELFWMLAVLWKHPPALNAEMIELWLDDTGWKPQVEPLYRQL